MTRTLSEIRPGDVVGTEIVIGVQTFPAHYAPSERIAIPATKVNLGLTGGKYITGLATDPVPDAQEVSPRATAEYAMVEAYRLARKAWETYNAALPELLLDLDLTDEDRLDQGYARCPFITEDGSLCESELYMIFDAHETANVYGWGKPVMGGITGPEDVLELHHGFGEDAETDDPTDLKCHEGHAWRVPDMDRRSSV